MNSDGLQRRLLELQSKIQQGQEAMREWAELQIQLQGPNLAAGNVNPYLTAVRSVPTQNPPPSGRQEAGPSHPPATSLSVQQRPPAPTYPPNNISQPSNVGAPAFPSVRQPQPSQSSIQAPGRHDGSALDARNRTVAQVPHIPAPPRNQSAPTANGLAGYTTELEAQARKMVLAGYSRNAPGYAPPGQSTPTPVPQQQQPAAPPQGTAARQVQPMHVMQVARQQPQIIGSSSTSTFHANGQTNVGIPQHQSYYRPRPDSISANAQPIGTSSEVPPPPGRTNRSIGYLPEWTDRELASFKYTLEAWRQKVAIGTSFDLAQYFHFGEGYSIRNLADGIYVEDNSDKMKCPIAALYEQLEKRKKPGSGSPQAAVTSSLTIQATAQPVAQTSVKPLPGPQPSAPSTSATPSNLTSQPPISSAQSHPAFPVLNSALPAQAFTVAPGSNSAPQPPPSAFQAFAVPPMPISISQVPPSKSQALTVAPVPDPKPQLPPSAPQASAVTPATNPASRPPASAAPGPVTPTSQARKSLTALAPTLRSPANANKKTLARDVLFALGKRSRPSNEQTPGPAAKRPAMSSFVNPSPNGTSATVSGVVLLQPTPTLPPSVGVFPYNSQGNRSATIVGLTGSSLSALPQSAPQGTASLPSTPKPAEVTGTSEQPSHPPQASENPPVPVTVPASPLPTVPPRLPSPVRPHSSPPEHIASSPSFPPIATIDEIASLSSRPESPVLAQNPVRSPSITVSDIAPYPPPSSKSTTSAEAGPSNSKVLAAEARSTPSSRKASPAISIRSDVSEPLFLPSGSPLSSPAPADRNARLQKIARKGKGKERETPKQQVYVLIPPPSPRTKRFMELQRRPSPSQDSRSTPSTKTPRRSSSRTVTAPSVPELELWPLEEEDEKEYDYSYDAQGNKIEDPTERALVERACTQLQPLPCKWDRCEVVMNSVIGMLSHLKKQHRPVMKDERAHFSCRWSQCGKQCRPKDNKHFVKHALEYLTCPYIGCREKFRTVGQLRRHANSHPDEDEFKLSFKPFAPTNLVPPPAAPGVLPTFMVVTRPVRPASISPAQHEQLYPKVLKKVKGLFKRGKPTNRLDRYSFLTDYPSRPSSYLSQPAEGIKMADMNWSVRLTELCRQDRVTILDGESRRAVIAKTPEPEVKDEEVEQIRFDSPSEPELIGLETRNSSQDPVGLNQNLFEQEVEEEENGEETESEVYSVGAGVIDDDEVEEAGESDLVASLLL